MKMTELEIEEVRLTLVAQSEIMRRLREAQLTEDINQIIGGKFLFVPENKVGGAMIQIFTVASIEISQTSPNFLRLTVANQPSGALVPRLVVYVSNQKRWHLFHEHQLEHGEGHKGFLKML